MTIEVINAIITNATIEIDDHNRLTSWLTLDYGSSCQGFGGFRFDKKTPDGRIPTVFGTLFIIQCLYVTDVRNWNNIKGKSIRVRVHKENESILEIGHITKEIWFNPGKEYRRLETFDSIQETSCADLSNDKSSS